MKGRAPLFHIKTKCKRKLYTYLENKSRWQRDYKKQLKAPKKIILVNTPEYRNLGDQAILLSEIEFLSQIAPDYQLIELPAYVIHNYSYRKLKKIIGNNLLLIQAGGYLGTIWMNEEENVRKILSLFPDNPTIILPQTVTFSEDVYGLKQKEITKAIYKNSKNLKIFVRDQKSVAVANELAGKENVHLVPDMVVGYAPEFVLPNSESKSGCLLCLRQDKEKVLDSANTQLIERTLNELFPNRAINYTDTVITEPITKDNRYNAVYNKIKEFSEAEIIVTDRLHGMLFSALAGTPCLVLNNENKKVEGVYQWIKDLPYIQFIDDLSELETALTKLKDVSATNYVRSQYRPKYDSLINEIQDKLVS